MLLLLRASPNAAAAERLFACISTWSTSASKLSISLPKENTHALVSLLLSAAVAAHTASGAAAVAVAAAAAVAAAVETADISATG